MDEKEDINHEQILRDRYTERARKTTPDELPKFIEDIMSDEHTNDYGGVCVAIALVAVASAWAMNRHPGARGGVTGFQAGAIFWEFARGWGSPDIGEAGAKLVIYEDMLYPQYESKFERSVPQSAVDQVKKLARDRLDEGVENVHPNVVQHWKSLADGRVPFGLEVRE